jgi:hypothetical protein
MNLAILSLAWMQAREVISIIYLVSGFGLFKFSQLALYIRQDG